MWICSLCWMLLFSFFGARVPFITHKGPPISEVAPGLYRGEDATRDDLPVFKKYGIKTILSVRTRRQHRKAKFFEDNGIRYVHLTTGVFKVPTDDDVQRVLAVVRDLKNQPVYIACKGNRDRTSYYVACYRILEQGKSYDEAMKEFTDHEVRRWWPIFRDYKEHLRAYADQKSKSAKTGL